MSEVAVVKTFGVSSVRFTVNGLHLLPMLGNNASLVYNIPIH